MRSPEEVVQEAIEDNAYGGSPLTDEEEARLLAAVTYAQQHDGVAPVLLISYQRYTYGEEITYYTTSYGGAFETEEQARSWLSEHSGL